MTQASGVRSLALAAAVWFTVIALAGYQVSGTTAASRLLGRLVGALVEIDRWLPAHREDIDLLVEQRFRGTVEVEGLPLDVSLAADQASGASDQTLERLILASAGRTLHGEGMSAFRDDIGDGGSLGLNEPVRWTVALLGGAAHRFWTFALAAGLLVTLGGVLAVVLAGAEDRTRSALRAAGAGAGLATGAFALAWVLAGAASSFPSDPVDREIALIARDGAWIGVRDGLAIAGAALAFLVLARLGRRAGSVTDPWPGALDET